uniref:Uncharacterized protein n=1 Tax=Kalanchoe fedtschenkoi TaxID=63787 RepID=A0A7N0T2M4_KALFE
MRDGKEPVLFLNESFSSRCQIKINNDISIFIVFTIGSLFYSNLLKPLESSLPKQYELNS